MLSHFSHVWFFATQWTIAHQAPLSMGFSRQEYWSRLPFPSPEDLPDPGIEPGLLYCRRILYQVSYQGKASEGELKGSLKKWLNCCNLMIHFHGRGGASYGWTKTVICSQMESTPSIDAVKTRWNDKKGFRMLHKLYQTSWSSRGRVWEDWLQFWKFSCG